MDESKIIQLLIPDRTQRKILVINDKMRIMIARWNRTVSLMSAARGYSNKFRGYSDSSSGS